MERRRAEEKSGDLARGAMDFVREVIVVVLVVEVVCERPANADRASRWNSICAVRGWPVGGGRSKSKQTLCYLNAKTVESTLKRVN